MMTQTLSQWLQNFPLKAVRLLVEKLVLASWDNNDFICLFFIEKLEQI